MADENESELYVEDGVVKFISRAGVITVIAERSKGKTTLLSGEGSHLFIAEDRLKSHTAMGTVTDRT